MKVKTAELTGTNLAYFVAIADGKQPKVPAWAEEPRVYLLGDVGMRPERYRPHEDPSQGWPIIEREGILVLAPRMYRISEERHAFPVKQWRAMKQHEDEAVTHGNGPTRLIAAMCCFATYRLGDEVEIPWELKS